jgi:maltose alpha-D-glucosyltransferase / alpha-amylase
LLDQRRLYPAWELPLGTTSRVCLDPRQLRRTEGREIIMRSSVAEVPLLNVPGAWESVFEPAHRAALEAILPGFLQQRRWFAGKARDLKSVEIADVARVPETSPAVYLTFARVLYAEGDPDLYVLPLTFTSGQPAEEIIENWPVTVIARLSWTKGGILYEALREQNLPSALLNAMAHKGSFPGTLGKIVAAPTGAFPELRGAEDAPLHARVMSVEQSNTSIVLGEKLMLKVFRRLQEGINPDVEIGTFLTERTSFRHFPPVAGTVNYQRHDQPSISLAILQAFVPNQGDAWQFTLNALRGFFDRLAAGSPGLNREPKGGESAEDDPMRGLPMTMLMQTVLPPLAKELLGDYLDAARLLGQRTAELHMALGSESDDPNFAPEPFTEAYQLSMCKSMCNLTGKVFQMLRTLELPQIAPEQVERALQLEPEILRRFAPLVERKITASRTRIHGDFHLGQVLHTGTDFVIIDFEGEPGRSMAERRSKFSPLRDVAGMLRSFHYAAHSSLISRSAEENRGPGSIARLERWAQCWYTWSCSVFLNSYLQVAGRAAFVPQTREELQMLLEAFLLEKAIYELGYELNNRPDWVTVPLRGILQLVEPGL